MPNRLRPEVEQRGSFGQLLIFTISSLIWPSLFPRLDHILILRDNFRMVQKYYSIFRLNSKHVEAEFQVTSTIGEKVVTMTSCNRLTENIGFFLVI